MAATVTGILRTVTGPAESVLFRATGTRLVGGAAVGGGRIEAECDANGGFSQELVAGVWEMIWPASGEGRALLTVPDDDNTYNFAALLGTGTGVAASEDDELKIVTDIAAMKALPSSPGVASLLKAVIVQTPGPGYARFYYYVYGSIATADGFNVIADNLGLGRFFAVV